MGAGGSVAEQRPYDVGYPPTCRELDGSQPVDHAAPVDRTDQLALDVAGVIEPNALGRLALGRQEEWEDSLTSQAYQ